MTVFQTASAEGYLYLFKKSTGDFAAVEALQEEVLDGNLKLTTPEGKIIVWGQDLLVCKFPRFDEAVEIQDPSGIQTNIDAIQKFIEEEPDSLMYLQSLLNQRKELQARLQTKAQESTEVADAALGRYLADGYNENRLYSMEYLEAKLKRGEEFKKYLPEQSAKITAYMEPWADELQNRQAGRERYEGKWVSAKAIAQMKTAALDAERKAFLEKEMIFQVPQEAVSQQLVYIGLGVIGFSVLIMIALLFHGLMSISQGFGLGAVLSLLFGLGGLAAYGYGAWEIFQVPDNYVSAPASKVDGEIKTQDNLDIDEWIFRIHRSGGKLRTDLPLPSRFVVENAKLNTFLGKYLKVPASPGSDAYAVTRKGLKVRVLVDRIVVFDELVWFKKDVIVSYSILFADNNGGFQFFGNTATAGGLPLPGKVFQYLWNEVLPVVTLVLDKTRVLQEYQIVRMETNSIELVSLRNPPKPPAP